MGFSNLANFCIKHRGMLSITFRRAPQPRCSNSSTRTSLICCRFLSGWGSNMGFPSRVFWMCSMELQSRLYYLNGVEIMASRIILHCLGHVRSRIIMLNETIWTHIFNKWGNLFKNVVGTSGRNEVIPPQIIKALGWSSTDCHTSINMIQIIVSEHHVTPLF